jgi:hypothetical protein
MIFEITSKLAFKLSNGNVKFISQYHPGTELKGLENPSEERVSWPRLQSGSF